MTHVVDRLQIYLDGELPAPAAREVAGHLRECAACREELAALQALWRSVDGAAPPPLPRSLWPRIRAARRGRTLDFPLDRLRRTLAAAAVLAGLVAGLAADRFLHVSRDGAATGLEASAAWNDLPTLDEVWWSAGQTAGEEEGT